MSKSMPAGFSWRSHPRFILTTVAIGLFTDLFLYGLVVPVLPFLLEDRAMLPPAQIQSYTSGLLAVYAGSTVIFSPVAGIVADKMSTRQAPFLFGLACLFGSTVLLFASAAVPMLVLARALQGTSCAFVWTIGLAICIETVGPEKMGRTMGVVWMLPFQ